MDIFIIYGLFIYLLVCVYMHICVCVKFIINTLVDTICFTYYKYIFIFYKCKVSDLYILHLQNYR